MNFNLYSFFEKSFIPNLEKTFMITEGNKEFSYEDLHKKSSQYANYLVSIGIKKSDRVVVQVEKSSEALFFYLGCLKMGAIYIPLNVAYQKLELEYFIEDAEPKLIVCDTERYEEISSLIKNSSKIDTLDKNGHGTLFTNVTNLPKDFQTVENKKDDIAVILYTSGTTGKPKGAMLSHSNLALNGQTLKDYWGFSKEDIVLHMLPIFHVHGLFFALHTVLLSSATIRFLPKFTPDYVIDYLPTSTIMMGVPTYYVRLLADDRFSKETCRNIRLFISGSAPLTEQTFYDFKDRTGFSILERYGMTETGINTSNPLNGERIPGSVGLPLPGVDIRIVDDNNNLLPTEDIGNIQIKGPNIFIGYWKKPEKTAEEFTSDGFFKTGDNGKRDQNGYVYIIGRSKDLVITGGLNVYPKEIEMLIDKINGVYESAVIGLPHKDFGEAVTAVVVKNKDSEINETEIINSLKREIANFKVPKRVIFVDQLPRNTMGKVQKELLRNSYK